MKLFRSLIALLMVCVAVPDAVAARHRNAANPPETPEYRVVEVNAVLITVTVGKSGDQHMAYKITDATKVTLNGAPAFARDLRPGMMVQVEIAPDHTTALSLHAKDPPASHGHHRVG